MNVSERTLFVILLVICLWTNVDSIHAQNSPILTEDFAYSTGQLTDASGGANVSGGNWITNTGTGNFIQVTSGNLDYPNYPTSTGNKINLIASTASSEDSYRSFAAQSTGKVYAAFLVNITDTTLLPLNSSTTGEYFAGLISSTSTTNFACRVTIRQGAGANTYQMGFRATGNAANAQVFSSTDLPVGNTMLVVISYQIVDGVTNDITQIWINPALGGAEPLPTLSQTSAADSTDIGRFFVRQGSGSGVSSPNASIDGIRIGSTWESVTTSVPALKDVVADFNGDGLSDYAILRPSGGGSDPLAWWVYPNRAEYFYSVNWGVGSDFQVTGDFDGDNKDDLTVWRPGTIGQFFIIQSLTNTMRIEDFGQTGDDPTVVGDFNGDNKDDIAVYRAGVGLGNPSFWYWRPDPNTFFTIVPWGLEGDIPVPGDYDGDNKTDYVIFRENGQNGEFWGWLSTDGFGIVPFGLAGDMIVAGDYDGDGSDDLCVVRAESGNWRWEFKASGTAGNPVSFEYWGVTTTDIPIAGSYNRNGSADFAVWREGTTSTFWSFNFNSREISFINWGVGGDLPALIYAARF